MTDLNTLDKIQLQTKLATNLLKQKNIITTQINTIHFSETPNETYENEVSIALKYYENLYAQAINDFSSTSEKLSENQKKTSQENLDKIFIKYKSVLDKIENKYINKLKEINSNYRQLTIDEASIRSILDERDNTSYTGYTGYLKRIPYDYKYLKYKTKYLELI